MFEIEYKGGNGITISTKKMTAVIDPRLSVIGLSDMTVGPDCVEIATEERFALKSTKAQLAIEGPGEYEVGPFSVRGVAAQRHLDAPEVEKLSTVYRIEVGDTRIALVGNIAPDLNDEQLEEIGVVDMLVLPIGGNGYTLDATSAAAIVRAIDPKVVIPVSYADEGLAYEVPQDALSVFVGELGVPVETVAKYKVKAAAALPAALTIVEVTRS